MFETIFLTISLITSITRGLPDVGTSYQKPLATQSISLQTRQPDKWVNGIFKDNILLAMSYLRGEVKSSRDINWYKVREPFHYEMMLKSGELFAFQEDSLPQYQRKVSKSIYSHFNFDDGYKSDGYLMGNGICHLASLVNWVAQDAKLDVVSPTAHDFAVIPEIPVEFGVSIYYYPGRTYSNYLQNLYIRNSLQNDVVFVFDYDGKGLKVSVFIV